MRVELVRKRPRRPRAVRTVPEAPVDATDPRPELIASAAELDPRAKVLASIQDQRVRAWLAKLLGTGADLGAVLSSNTEGGATQ
jgi:hypothetical protein